MNLHSQIMSLRLQFDAELEEAKNTAYSEGRKDEREASCVDELVAALEGMLFHFGKPKRDEWLNDAAFSEAQEADAKARAVLTKLEQS